MAQPRSISTERKIWLAIHAWYHPASDTDSYRRNISKALDSVGVDFGIVRGRAIPSGPISQSILPVLLRDLVSYGRFEGLVHDLYGDSVFRNVDVATIQDLYWNSSQVPRRARLVQVSQLLYQAYGRTLRRCKVTIATTAFIRDELLRYFGSNFKGKIEIVPIPCQPEETGKADHSRYDVLWVGSSQTRKAPLEFVKVIDQLPRSLKIAIRLRASSKITSDDVAEIRRRISEYRRGGRRVDLFEAEMSWDSMEELYRSSKSLVSTSTYDGFHMPVAEAYFRGVNVVLPDTEFYRCTYADEEGVHWYQGRGTLADTIVRATEHGNFRVDPSIADTHSYRRVGSQLKAIYERISGR